MLKGSKHSEGAKLHMRQAWISRRLHCKPYEPSKESNLKRSQSLKATNLGKYITEEQRQRGGEIGRANKGRFHNEKTKATIGQSLREFWGNYERSAAARLRRSVPRSETTRLKIGRAQLQIWQDPIVKHRRVKAIFKAINIDPNLCERKVIVLLDTWFPGEWEYVGNGELIIGGKCPDYWNRDHELIEFYGDYFHRGEDPQKRIDHFAKYGYKCLVIWEHELANEAAVKSRVREFSCEIR